MAQTGPLTSAAQNFFSQFNAGQERQRQAELVQLQKQKRQDTINAAALKRRQDVDDQEDLALSIEQAIGIPTGDRAEGEKRGPGRVQDFVFATDRSRKAFADSVSRNPAVSAPILNFLSKSNDFQLQQKKNKTDRLFRGWNFLQEQKKKGQFQFQEGIKQLVGSGLFSEKENKKLVALSNQSNQDLVDLTIEKGISDTEPEKIMLDDELARRKEGRAEQETIRQERRGERETMRKETRAEAAEIRKEQRTPVKPLSSIAKLNADFDAGLINERERSAGIAKATRAESLVNIQSFEQEAAKLGARSDATVRDEVRGNARLASRSTVKVRNLSNLLKQSAAGGLTQILPQLGRLIPFIDVGGDEQAALAQINSFVLDQMQAFKGTTSDRELDFAKTTVARLGNTREANEIIMRSFSNLIFLSQQENKQFDEFTKEGGKGRDFIFNFQKVLFSGHPTFGNVTLDDIQTTAFENGITMEEAINEMRKR